MVGTTDFQTMTSDLNYTGHQNIEHLFLGWYRWCFPNAPRIAMGGMDAPMGCLDQGPVGSLAWPSHWLILATRRFPAIGCNRDSPKSTIFIHFCFGFSSKPSSYWGTPFMEPPTCYSGRFATTTARTGVLAPRKCMCLLGYIVPMTPMLGLCCAHVGHKLRPCGATQAHAGPMLKHVVPMLSVCWRMLSHVGPILGACWAYVGPMLGPCCAHVEPEVDKLAHVGPMLGAFWAYVGPMLGHVEPNFGNLADFTTFSKTWKNTQF